MTDQMTRERGYMEETSEQRVNRLVGANVRAEMARAGRTQEQIAAALHTGQSNLSSRLAGAVPFRIPELVTISEVLGVPLTRFFVDVA